MTVVMIVETNTCASKCRRPNAFGAYEFNYRQMKEMIRPYLEK